MEHIVIIGNGISGVTAARHIRKNSDKKITIVSAESTYFFARTALMYVYMGHLKFEHTQPYENWFWEKNNIQLKQGFVNAIHTDKKQLEFTNGETLSFDKLVIATGSKPNKFGWPGQDLEGVMGMYHKQDLEKLEKYAPNNTVCNSAVIVGGGLIGIELAEMLRSRKIPVTFLVREDSFWNGVLPAQESALINEHIKEHHIDLRLSTNLKEIKSDENGRVKSIIIEETGEEITCNIVGLTAGVTPNIDFLKESGIALGKGVKVNRFLETNIKDIYAIGDCAEQHEAIGQRRNIEAVWYTGRMMGETLAQTICGNKIEYKPGHWFNSAKFLDIEYQTYGWVFSEKGTQENEAYFQWKHPKDKKCITISFDKNTHQFLGINTFGIRMRHEIFDTWLTEKQSISHVLEYLADANFDPEFYKLHEPEIVAKFNQENNTNIQPKKEVGKEYLAKLLNRVLVIKNSEPITLKQHIILKFIKQSGLVIFLLGLAIFIGSIFSGSFNLTQTELNTFLKEQDYKSTVIKGALEKAIVTSRELNIFEFSSSVRKAYKASNDHYTLLIQKYNKEKNWSKKGEQYKYKISGKPHSLSFTLAKKAGKGLAANRTGFMWLLTFGLGIIGALLFIVPDVVLLGKPGIKNDGVFLHAATNRGWIGWFAFVFLVTFYILLYFYPDFIVNWVFIVDPISQFTSGNPASQWFLYGFLYCTVMSVMAVRMYIKYRHNKYQILRTTSVLFFQIVFAFLIPEILVRFEKPWYDFKNAFPLDYDFFFRWNLDELLSSGGFGLFILVWGVVLTVVIVPVMVYFFGKRWYCSWVCGCGGLAETLGDPYRQLSSKTLLSWKFERIVIHSVLIFVLVMTGFALYTFFSGASQVIGIKTQTIQDIYGFLIGSIFAGVIGTGFYPIFGNRVWCRFGCPLAAYLGFIQRFKSKFRITTNGGQCISCGNCSTYCEQGIDVRAYAQKGENIVRSSCVGCGICAAVCPRGVLKLENGPEEGRINPTDILLGNDVNLMELVNKK